MSSFMANQLQNRQSSHHLCSWLNNSLNEVYVPIPSAIGYVTSHGKRDLANVVKLRVLRREDNPDYLCGLNIILIVFIRKRRRQEKRRRDNISIREGMATKTEIRVRGRLKML